VQQADSCAKDRLRNEVKILDGDTIDKIGELKKLNYLARVILGSTCTLLVNYTQAQLASLLLLLKDRKVATCSLVED